MRGARINFCLSVRSLNVSLAEARVPFPVCGCRSECRQSCCCTFAFQRFYDDTRCLKGASFVTYVKLLYQKNKDFIMVTCAFASKIFIAFFCVFYMFNKKNIYTKLTLIFLKLGTCLRFIRRTGYTFADPLAHGGVLILLVLTNVIMQHTVLTTGSLKALFISKTRATLLISQSNAHIVIIEKQIFDDA